MQAQKQRVDLDEARRRYLAALDATLRTVRERLAKGQFEDALDELRQAGGKNGTDPVLESAIAFVKRRQKQKGVWDGADQKVLDAMVRDSIVWKGARADPARSAT